MATRNLKDVGEYFFPPLYPDVSQVTRVYKTPKTDKRSITGIQYTMTAHMDATTNDELESQAFYRTTTRTYV